MTSPDIGDVTTGELSRGLSRVEREMQLGLTAIRDEIRALRFVQPDVYASDMRSMREWVTRVEEDLEAERDERRQSEQVAQQRAWQSKWAITMAMVGMPISIVGAVITALIVAGLK